MDSKYSIFAKNRPDSSSFGQNFKRKFSYSSSAGAPPAKKPNLHTVTKSSNQLPKPNSTQNGSTTNKSTVVDIQMQRRRLPVFAVRDQYVNLTTILSFVIVRYNKS